MILPPLLFSILNSCHYFCSSFPKNAWKPRRNKKIFKFHFSRCYFFLQCLLQQENEKESWHWKTFSHHASTAAERSSLDTRIFSAQSLSSADKIIGCCSLQRLYLLVCKTGDVCNIRTAIKIIFPVRASVFDAEWRPEGKIREGKLRELRPYTYFFFVW